MKIKNKERVCTCCDEVGHYGGKWRAKNESNPKDGWFRLYWENESALNHIYYGKIWKPSKNDQLRYEWKYKDGKRADGVSKGWFPNGQIKNIRTFKDGEEDGLWTEWYENGYKEKEGTFKDSSGNPIPDGVWTYWYENGQKEKEIGYKDGKENGKWTYWYENGQKKYETTYKDGNLIK